MRILFFSFLFVSFIAKGQITFNKTYDNGIDNTFNSLEVDDGFITVTTSGQPTIPRYIFVLKVDLWGDTLWQKRYGDTAEYTAFYSIIRLSDASFITGCYASNNSLNTRYIYLLKLNYNGDTIWTKKISPPAGFDYSGQYLMLNSDKKILITGQISDNPVTDGNGFLLMTDTNGNYEWHHTFGGANYDQVYSSVELPDHGFFSLGWTRSFGFGSSTNRDVYLVKSDSLGNFEWYKTYGNLTFETGFGIFGLMDNNYLLATDKIISSIEYGWMIKIDTSGAVIWDHYYNFGQSSEIWWSRELPNKDIVSVGSCTNDTTQLNDGLIFLTDEFGNLKWFRTFPMNNDHACFRDVQLTSDGGFICAGFCFTGASGNQDAWLVKLDGQGCDSAGCPTYATGIEEKVKSKRLIVYPNPAVDKLFYQSDLLVEEYMLSIFDARGRCLISLQEHDSRETRSIDISGMPSGIYMISCVSEKGKRVWAKFIKSE